MGKTPRRKLRDHLTPNDFRQAPAGAERRREPRVGCEKDVAILPCRIEEGWGYFSARMFDCSLRGIGIISERRIAEGEHFMVRAKLDVVRVVIYAVRHCQKGEAGRFKIGAELVRVAGMDAGQQTEGFLKSMLESEHPVEPDAPCPPRNEDGPRSRCSQSENDERVVAPPLATRGRDAPHATGARLRGPEALLPSVVGSQRVSAHA